MKELNSSRSDSFENNEVNAFRSRDAPLCFDKVTEELLLLRFQIDARHGLASFLSFIDYAGWGTSPENL
jgi:hypothetical protein